METGVKVNRTKSDLVAVCGFRTGITGGSRDGERTARKLMGAPPVVTGMSLVATALQSGSLTSPPALLVGVAVLAVIILVGRIVMKVAWRLVLIALIALATLWILGILGFQTGVF